MMRTVEQARKAFGGVEFDTMALPVIERQAVAGKAVSTCNRERRRRIETAGQQYNRFAVTCHARRPTGICATVFATAPISDRPESNPRDVRGSILHAPVKIISRNVRRAHAAGSCRGSNRNL